MVLRITALALLAATLTAVTTGAQRAKVTSVVVRPDTMTLLVGETGDSVTCTPRNRFLQPLANACTWRATDTTVARVVPFGTGAHSAKVVARKRGTALVIATSSGRADTMTFTALDSVTLSVVSILVRPDSVKVDTGGKVQFCAAARLSNDSIVLTANSQGVAACPPYFQSMPGFSLSEARVRDSVFTVTIDGSDHWFVRGRRTPNGSGYVAAPGDVPYQLLRPRVLGAHKMFGEWWLDKPIPLPKSS
jgi:hypothetical protein